MKRVTKVYSLEIETPNFGPGKFLQIVFSVSGNEATKHDKIALDYYHQYDGDQVRLIRADDRSELARNY